MLTYITESSPNANGFRKTRRHGIVMHSMQYIGCSKINWKNVQPSRYCVSIFNKCLMCCSLSRNMKITSFCLKNNAT